MILFLVGLLVGLRFGVPLLVCSLAVRFGVVASRSMGLLDLSV